MCLRPHSVLLRFEIHFECSTDKRENLMDKELEMPSHGDFTLLSIKCVRKAGRGSAECQHSEAMNIFHSHVNSCITSRFSFSLVRLEILYGNFSPHRWRALNSLAVAGLLFMELLFALQRRRLSVVIVSCCDAFLSLFSGLFAPHKSRDCGVEDAPRKQQAAKKKLPKF